MVPDGQQMQINPVEFGKWQGGVDEHLRNVDTRLECLESDVKDLPDKIEKRVEKVVNGHVKGKVDFKWLLERVAIPVIASGGSAAAAIYAAIHAIKNVP